MEIRIVKTTSEHHPDVPLSVIDQRDVFTRQLDEALLSGEIDLAVHSLKDVPTEVPEGIVLAAVTERHDTADALVSEERWTVDGVAGRGGRCDLQPAAAGADTPPPSGP